jgi:hypothetical protein
MDPLAPIAMELDDGSSDAAGREDQENKPHAQPTVGTPSKKSQGSLASGSKHKQPRASALKQPQAAPAVWTALKQQLSNKIAALNVV